MGAPGERLKATETCSIQKIDPIKHINERTRQPLKPIKGTKFDDEEAPISVQTQVFIKED